MFYPYFICIIQIYTILMANTLLQWNCRGLKANFNEVGLLSQRNNPQAICLQETLLQDTDNIDFRGFTLLNTFSGIGPHGGSSILIRQGVLHSPVKFNHKFAGCSRPLYFTCGSYLMFFIYTTIS